MESNRFSSDKEYRVLSVLPILGHITDSKRISMLQRAGFSVEVIAFQRKHHSARLPDCPVTKLGKIKNGQYIRRIFKLIVAIPAIRNAMRCNDLTYSSGPDMTLTAIIAGIGLGKPVVMEVGDIRKIQIDNGIMGWLVRKMDRFVVNVSKLLIVTAPDFIDGYYRGWLKTQTPTLILENKLEKSNEEDSQTANLLSNSDNTLTIGYFGVLRCDWSWQVLEKLALSRPNDIKVIVAGHILEPANLVERAAKISNVEYRGEYRSPQDLPSLYGDVDIVWACYPPPGNKNKNWRWAQLICRSNRFYESCYFKKPIISVAGSGDAKEVERYGIGEVVSDQSIDAMVATLTKITKEQLLRWDENISKIPKSVYEYTTEVDDLGNAIRKILKSNEKDIINE